MPAGRSFAAVLAWRGPCHQRRQFDVNVFGAVAMMKAVLPSMRERRNGHTVNITSMAAYVECTAGAAQYNSALGGIFGVWLSDQRCAMLAAHWQ